MFLWVGLYAYVYVCGGNVTIDMKGSPIKDNPSIKMVKVRFDDDDGGGGGANDGAAAAADDDGVDDDRR